MERKINLEKGVDFIINSIDPVTGGSCAFFSRFANPIKGWSRPYPETSGYIISTLLDVIRGRNDVYLEKYAFDMADWLCSLQDDDGAFPGGLCFSEKEHQKSIFNTAQIMLGLVSAWRYTHKKEYLNSASKAAKWLANVQESDGTWTKYHYNVNFFPSYYTRVAWPLLQTAIETQDKNSEKAALKTLDLITTKVQDNSFIRDSGFESGKYTFLHTIAYTIRGFLESYFLTQREDYLNAAYNWSYKLMRKYELRKRLAGAYYEDFKEVNWYRCLTGEAQISIIWLKLFSIKNDIRFVNATSKLLDDVCSTQPLKDTFFLKAGGLKGSQPYYGRYLFLRQPNWATKFLIDALLLEENTYKIIENKMGI